MKNWMIPGLTIFAVAMMSHVAGAQDNMTKPMGKEKTYTGCVAAGEMAGTYTLTHATAETAMGGDAMMKKGTMGKDAMAKPAMGKPMVISSTSIDLAKHVGHQVSVTGPESMAMGKDTMGKDTMGKATPAWSVTALKMIAATCGK